MATADQSALTKLIATAVAAEWTGPDPDADDLRTALADAVTKIVARADQVTRGGTSSAYAAVLDAYRKQSPAGPPPVASPSSGPISPDEAAARRMVQALLHMIPEPARSLPALVTDMQVQPSPPPPPSGPAPASSPGPPTADQSGQGQGASSSDKDTEDKEKERAWLDIPVNPTALATAWPSPPRLSKLIKDTLAKLRKLSCATALVDLETWLTYVPPRAATSYAVAGAIQTAFAGVDVTGITSSSLSLGNAVHDRIEANAARSLAPLFDRYLVAENSIYPPGNAGIPGPLEVWADNARNVSKEFSLTALQNSRGQAGLIRSRRATTSREDLVVFYRSDVCSLPGPLAVGRPEVYEVKAVGSLLDAVPQVTAYSINYLWASAYLRCGKMLTVPGARMDNTLMLPASPEFPSIPIPCLCVSDLPGAVTAAASPTMTAAQIAAMVQQFLNAALSVPPYLAVPFMVSGLYGVIPYFVIDMGQLVKAIQAALQAIIEALIAALLAYLAAKKLLEKLADVGEALAKALAAVVVVILCVVAMFLLAPIIAAALGISLATVGVVAAAALILIVVGAASGLGGGPGGGPGGARSPDPNRIDPGTSPLTLHLPPFEVEGITARQIATFASMYQRATLDFWRQGAFTSQTSYA